jgi:hypothetical protein
MWAGVGGGRAGALMCGPAPAALARRRRSDGSFAGHVDQIAILALRAGGRPRSGRAIRAAACRSRPRR